MVQAPGAIWHSILASLDTAPVETGFRWWQFAAAFGLVMAVGLLWVSTRAKPASWEVVPRLDGSPSVGSKHMADTGRIAVGEWLQTDASSRARIGIGEIGGVEVEPNSRVRLLSAKPDDHRLALDRGEISAVVSAPPRLFFVETAASTCGGPWLRLQDENGRGRLRDADGIGGLGGSGLEGPP